MQFSRYKVQVGKQLNLSLFSRQVKISQLKHLCMLECCSHSLSLYCLDLFFKNNLSLVTLCSFFIASLCHFYSLYSYVKLVLFLSTILIFSSLCFAFFSELAQTESYVKRSLKALYKQQKKQGNKSVAGDKSSRN